MKSVDLIILGAGISGMGAAWKAKELGLNFVVLEASESPGGVLQTLQVEGHTLDLGANSAATTEDFEAFLQYLGLSEHKVPASDLGKNRFLWHYTGVEQIKPSPFALLGAKWLSSRGKRALFSEPFRKKGPVEDETVHAFLSRRIGREATEKLVDPVLSGIYAGDIKKLSANAVFPALKQGEQEYGSLFKSFLKNKPAKRNIINFEGGFGAIAKHFEAHFSEALHLNTPVEVLSREGDHWLVKSGTQVWRAPKVVSALPAYALSKILEPSLTHLSKHLQSLNYAELQVTYLAESKTAQQIEGFGILVPSYMDKNVKGVLFASEVFNGRAPKGQRNLTVFHRPAEEGKVLEELDLMLGPGSRKVLHTKVWDAAIPQFECGYDEWKSVLIEHLPKGLFLAGNYLGKVSVADSLTSGYSLNLRP